MSGPSHPGRRRAIGAAVALMATTASAQSPTPIEAQGARIARAYRAEEDAAGECSRVEGTDREARAEAARCAAHDRWAAAVEALAGMPATCLPDVMVKAALVSAAACNGCTDADILLVESLQRDLWRLAPTARPLLPIVVQMELGA